MSTQTQNEAGIAIATLKANTFHFLPPGDIKDFPTNSPQYARLLELWNLNLYGFTQQALVGNTWNNLNTPPPSNYYNPAITTPPNPSGTGVEWSPFPGRFQTYYGSNSSTPLSKVEQYELGDTGYYTTKDGKKTFPQITAEPCSAFDGSVFPPTGTCGCCGNPSDQIPYGPYGPRGWQDEYCEWAVTRDSNGDITRIDFTCENPEYWNTLWIVSPEKVLELYQSTLGNPNIQMDDLVLKNGGVAVNDPGTGKPAYNPLNKWNTGPSVTSAGGGAMHLTSTPNTLQTEIGLAASATYLRNYPNGGQIPPSNTQTLLCSAQYGQYGRNSDPNIGAKVNQVAGAAMSVTLYNPPGLYIQLPQNLNAEFSITGVSDITPYFNISRKGETVVVDGVTYSLNLHVTVQAPAGMPPLSKMKVNSSGPLKWAGQIAEKFNMAILANAFGSTKPAALACSMPATTGLHAQPLQLFHMPIFISMTAIQVPNPVNFPMILLSNSTYVPPMVKREGNYKMVVTYVPSVPISSIKPTDPSTFPTVTFNDPNIEAKVSMVLNPLTYAVPGNSYPSQCLPVVINVFVGQNTTPGLHGLSMKDYSESYPGPVMPALIHVQ